MSVFKKNAAITIEKMNVLEKVVINEDTVRFTMHYSQMDLKPEQIPKLLSDVMQLYAMVKPALDKKTLDKKKEEIATAESDDTSIDLSDIPF